MANFRKCQDENCAYCGGFFKECYGCKKDYFSVDLRCVRDESRQCSISDCQQCYSFTNRADSGTPDEYRPRTRDSTGGVNDFQDVCSKCNSGYSLSGETNKCVKFQAGCATFIPSMKKCYSCDYGWYMNSRLSCTKGKT